MDVSEAVARRMAVRAFRADPVDAGVVRDILAAACRAPSGGNLQPWRVYTLGGGRLARFKARIAGQYLRGEVEPPEYAVYPPGLWDPYRRNFEFFGAPVGLFFCLDRRLGPPQWADVGMYMQTVMLIAVERGLDTCPQEIWARWPRTIREVLGLPDELMVFAGMALGYRDPDHPLNRLRTRRAPLEKVAELLGF